MVLEEFFRPGIEPEDLPALFPLLRSRDALNAFTSLFRGGDEEVVIRLLVLREIGHRGERPLWSTQEIRAHFAYLEETKLQTVLHRLRDTELLVWDTETSLYQISPCGRMALSALSVLLKFSEEDGDEIGYITSQLAAGQAVGKVSNDDLQHLLSRLNELEDEFRRAILSSSELRIRRAEKKLNSVVSWVEKGTAIMKTIAGDPDLDPATHRVAQRIGQVQSRMLHMSSMFQRTLNQLERQKVHLGQSGLSTADIHQWLRKQDVDQLFELLGNNFVFSVQRGFLLTDIATDVAEYELVERVRTEAEDVTLPPPLESPQTVELPVSREDLSRLHDFLWQLSVIERTAPLDETIPAENFATTSYRLSLAALLGDPESRALDGAVADLARLPLRLQLTGKTTLVGKYGVESMSDGVMQRISQGTEP